jgi:lysozyme
MVIPAMTLREQLRRDEGVRYEPYVDSKGFATIGVGTKLPLTNEEVNALMEIRLSHTDHELDLALPWARTLDASRRDALRNMAYNMGVPRLLGFKHTLAFLQAENWTQAAAEMLNSLWAKQVGDRATRLAKQVETGVMQ